MKRTGLIILALILGAGVVSGCAEKKQPAEKAQEAAVQAPEVKAEKAPEVKQETPLATAAPEETAVEKAIEKPAAEVKDVEAGAAIFKSKCSPCHGPAGKGTPMAPAFVGNDWIKSAANSEIAGVIKNGRDGAAKRYKKFAISMPANKGMAESDISALVDYIKSIN